MPRTKLLYFQIPIFHLPKLENPSVYITVTAEVLHMKDDITKQFLEFVQFRRLNSYHQP